MLRPDRESALTEILADPGQRTLISRGLGRSYGDASLNRDGGVVSHLKLNRLLAFDAEAGVLDCEAGVSLAEIVELVQLRGFWLPVTPGTRYVSLGGAIAADVHGKNHVSDGSFSRLVNELVLLTPAGERLTCSPRVNSDIFWATVGGMGLTGFIVSARLRLMRVPSRYMRLDRSRGADLATTLRALAESSRQYRYSVAWMDGLAEGRHLGRSVIACGDHATSAQVAANPRKERLTSSWSLRVPWELPVTSLHRFAAAAFNELYYRGIHEVRGDLVRCEHFFYPLDRIRDWNLLYGKRGLVQYQFVVPPEDAEEAIRAVLERLAAVGQRPLLAVMKVFGDAGPGLLSFPLRGFTLSLDLPVNNGTKAVLSELDEIVLRYGGRVYLAKDAALSAESFHTMYPNAERFQAIKRRLDPEERLSSSLARRVGLVEAA